MYIVQRKSHLTQVQAKVLHEGVSGQRQHDHLLHLGVAVQLRSDEPELGSQIAVRSLHEEEVFALDVETMR